jgi:putative Holliday junction resolvase
VRVLALDLGEARVGLALSDSRGVLASPYGTYERTGAEKEDLQALADRVRESGAELVVVGHPINLSGKRGQAAERAERVAFDLASLVSVPVELFDERLTTVEAARRRRDRSVSEKGRKKKTGRLGIDAEAAAILLEAYLERASR